MQPFIFGGNTGMTYEQMLQARAMADQLAAQQRAPQNVGEGWTALGRAFAERRLREQSNAAETAGKAEANSAFQGVLGQLFGQRVAGNMPAQQMDPNSPVALAGDTMAALGKDSGTAGYRASLIGTESGGNWAARNNEMGAGGKPGHFGRVQFGQARLQEAMNAGAIPQGTTPEQFMASPALQIAAENWHFGDLENQLGDLVGAEVNGKKLDMGALVAMGHLGGAGGARKYVESGGRYNPSDSFGTSLAEYAEKHGGQTTMSAKNGPGMPDQAALIDAMSNPYLSEGQRSVLGTLLQQQMQANDPRYQMEMEGARLGLEKDRLQLDQMRQPQVPAALSERQALAREAGLQPGSPEYQSYIATGNLPQGPAPTDDMREYEFARQQGFGGTFQDFMTQMRRAGATNVTTNVAPGQEPNDSELRKELMKGEGQTWAEYNKAGVTAAGMQQDLEALGQLSSVAPQGPVMGRIADMVPGVSSAGDAFKSIVSRVAPSLRVEGSGATSDIEYQGFLRSMPSLVNRPEANQAILAMLQSKAQINMDRAAAIRAYQNGEMSATDARRAISEIDSRSILTPELQSAFGGLGIDTQAPAASGGIPEGISPEDWEYLTPEERELWLQ